MAGITTHVLDVTSGRPLAGVRIELFDLKTEPPTLVASKRTNADGRTDAPMLAAADARPGPFELRFHAGEVLGASSFADIVPVRFAVFDPKQHYHVPLLCSPWSFSTYRGS